MKHESWSSWLRSHYSQLNPRREGTSQDINEYPWLERLRQYYGSTRARLNGHALEHKVGRFFEKWGAKTRVADPANGHDFGVDVEVVYLGLTFLIQVKSTYKQKTREFIRDYSKRVAMKGNGRKWKKGIVLWLGDFDEEALTIWEPLHAFITKGWFSNTIQCGAKACLTDWERYHRGGRLVPLPAPPKKKRRKGV